MVFALLVGLLSITFAIQGLCGTDAGFTLMGFIFGMVALLAGLGVIRMMLTRSLSWAQRIAPHLWRMCFALWIAAASFFLGQSDEFPEALRIMPLLCTPVLLVLLLMSIGWHVSCSRNGGRKSDDLLQRAEPGARL